MNFAAARRPSISRGYEQTPQSLALYRIAFALWTLFVLGPTRMGVGQVSGDYGDMPAGFYFPPLGPGMLLHGWPSTEVMLVMEVALTAGLFLVLIGLWTRAASIAVGLLGLSLSSLVFAGGKIDHTILWVVVLPLVMSSTSWGDTWSVDAARKRRNPKSATTQIQIIAAALGVMFAAAGAIKALTGWLDPTTSSILGWSYAQDVQVGIAINSTPGASFLPDAFFAGLDYVTILFEVGFLLAVLRRQWLIPYLVFACIFHLSAGASGFPGFVDIGIVYLLFLRLDRTAEHMAPMLDWLQRQPGLVLGATGLIFVAYSSSALVVGQPITVIGVLRRMGVPDFALWLIPLAAVAWVALRRRGEPRDSNGNQIPAWMLAVGVVVLATQLAATVRISEPYPSLAGPLFMGNFDDGDEIHVARQSFTVNGEPISGGDLLGLSPAAAVQLGSTRFPAPILDRNGDVLMKPTRAQVLAAQYHQFSGEHLDARSEEVSPEEYDWLRARAQDAGFACDEGCEIAVAWDRVDVDRKTGRVLAEKPVRQWVLTVR